MSDEEVVVQEDTQPFKPITGVGVYDIPLRHPASDGVDAAAGCLRWQPSLWWSC